MRIPDEAGHRFRSKAATQFHSRRCSLGFSSAGFISGFESRIFFRSRSKPWVSSGSPPWLQSQNIPAWRSPASFFMFFQIIHFPLCSINIMTPAIMRPRGHHCRRRGQTCGIMPKFDNRKRIPTTIKTSAPKLDRIVCLSFQIFLKATYATRNLHSRTFAV